MSEDEPRARYTDEERSAAAEMRVAFRRLQRLRSCVSYNFWASALGAVAVAVWVTFWPEHVDGSPALLLALVVVNLGFAWWIRRSLDRRPFTMVLVYACLHLAYAVWELAAEGMWGVSVTWAVLLGLVSVDAYNIERLARRYPDLYHAKRLRGEHLTHGGKVEGSIRERRRAAERARVARERRRRLIIGVSVIVVLVGGWLGYRAISAPPSPRSALERFQTGWNAADVDALVAEASSEEMRARLARNLPRAQERYEWGTHLPRLDDVTWERKKKPDGGHYARATFTGEAGELKCVFEYVDARWGVASIDFRTVMHWRP